MVNQKGIIVINNITQEFKSINKFDEFIIGVQSNRSNLSNMINKTELKQGVYIIQKPDQVIIKITGKAFATPNCIGYIQDKETFADDLTHFTRIEFDKDYLLNEAPVYEAHVTKDIDTFDARGYISASREILKRKTDKWDIYKYGDQKYIDGLAIVPKTKEKVRFIIYNKGVELRKYKNKEFRKIFSQEYLEQTRNMLRFEYQIRDFKHIREAFGLDVNEVPTIAALFDSKKNVVADMFDRFID